MNPGELNKRITIQALNTIKDENDFDVETWQDWKTVWASRKDLIGKEHIAIVIEQGETYATYKIRYLKDLVTSMRIVDNGIVFSIKSISDKDGQRRELYITAVRDDN